jgi:uroporphyrinogen-III synthase
LLVIRREAVIEPGTVLRVCSFETRRAEEMRSLIERHGGVATVVPSMREVPLESQQAAFAFAESLLNGGVDLVVFLTGVGARVLLEAVQSKYDRERFLEALRTVKVAVRGPKPTAVLREWKVPIHVRAPEPNTWRDLFEAIVLHLDPAGKRIAVQEYGRPTDDLYRALLERGADVTPVPVYRWALPEHVEPLERAIDETIAGRFDVLMFTSAHQLENVLQVARARGLERAWIEAANARAIASIGPMASEALREGGLSVDIEASPTKMGSLVRTALAEAPAVLAAKAAARRPGS